jgi:hypothetical protein
MVVSVRFKEARNFCYRYECPGLPVVLRKNFTQLPNLSGAIGIRVYEAMMNFEKI